MRQNLVFCLDAEGRSQVSTRRVSRQDDVLRFVPAMKKSLAGGPDIVRK